MWIATTLTAVDGQDSQTQTVEGQGVLVMCVHGDTLTVLSGGDVPALKGLLHVVAQMAVLCAVREPSLTGQDN